MEAVALGTPMSGRRPRCLWTRAGPSFEALASQAAELGTVTPASGTSRSNPSLCERARETADGAEAGVEIATPVVTRIAKSGVRTGAIGTSTGTKGAIVRTVTGRTTDDAPATKIPLEMHGWISEEARAKVRKVIRRRKRAKKVTPPKLTLVTL